jgi:hypothetical protein
MKATLSDGLTSQYSKKQHRKHGYFVWLKWLVRRSFKEEELEEEELVEEELEEEELEEEELEEEELEEEELEEEELEEEELEEEDVILVEKRRRRFNFGSSIPSSNFSRIVNSMNSSY